MDPMTAFVAAAEAALDDGIPAEELEHELALAIADFERAKTREAEPKTLKKKPKMKA